MKHNPLKPTTSVLCKLGSVVVHAEEMLSAKGHEFDRIALEQLLQDSELRTWIESMNKLAMLPVKR